MRPFKLPATLLLALLPLTSCLWTADPQGARGSESNSNASDTRLPPDDATNDLSDGMSSDVLVCGDTQCDSRRHAESTCKEEACQYTCRGSWRDLDEDLSQASGNGCESCYVGLEIDNELSNTEVIRAGKDVLLAGLGEGKITFRNDRGDEVSIVNSNDSSTIKDFSFHYDSGALVLFFKSNTGNDFELHSVNLDYEKLVESGDAVISSSDVKEVKEGGDYKKIKSYSSAGNSMVFYIQEESLKVARKDGTVSTLKKIDASDFSILSSDDQKVYISLNYRSGEDKIFAYDKVRQGFVPGVCLAEEARNIHPGSGAIYYIFDREIYSTMADNLTSKKFLGKKSVSLTGEDCPRSISSAAGKWFEVDFEKASTNYISVDGFYEILTCT